MSDFDSDESAWDSVMVRQPGTFGAAEQRRKANVLGGASYFVGVQEVPEHSTHRWWGKVEANPSRVIDPEGPISLCSVEELAVAARRMAVVAGEVVEPAAGVDDWFVKRVDVARDFVDVAGGSVLVRSLGAVPRAWARKNLVHADAQRNGAQTLMVGSGSGLARLYDQQAAHGAAPGSLRVEMECRSRWLRRYGDIRTFADLTECSVDALLRDRWSWSGMGVEVAGSVCAVVERVASAGLSEARADRFMGWLMRQAAGAGSELSGHSHWPYRKLQRELGIVVGPDVFEVRGAVWRRLDLETGTEVVRVA